MLILIIGGSGSGKSEIGENKAVSLYKGLNAKELIYIAAMKPLGGEAEERIKRHRENRRGKGFKTVECYTGLKALRLRDSVILLECISNLAANEIFDACNKNAADDIISAVEELNKANKAVVVITNDIFSDGADYGSQTMEYIKAVGEINRALAERADCFSEAVCGIELKIKGDVNDI